MWRISVFGVLVLGVALPLQGHGDLDRRLREADRRISEDPAVADGWWQRAELRLLHEEWSGAREDLRQVERLAPHTPRLKVRLAEAWAGDGEVEAAIRCLTEALAEAPNAADLSLRRAWLHVRIGAWADAKRDFDGALDRLTDPRPEDFLMRARACERLEDPQEAVEGLLRAIERLGPVPGLVQRLIALERQRGAWDAALGVVDTELARDGRSLVAWRLRVEILLEAGRSDAARDACRRMAAILDAEPPRVRERPDQQTVRAWVAVTLHHLSS